jgi:uncharacterized SAM-binding protein YcdF (DUF218 family)
MAVKGTLKRLPSFVLVFVICVFFFWLFSGPIFAQLGQFLICDQKPVVSDAIVVLCTGVEYYPRLIEAAELFKKGYAGKVAINGNRTTDELRDLRKRGFEECCPWHENSVRILEMLGVPRKDILTISAENAYDTVSEAEAVGRELIREGYQNVLIATSRSHTRRAGFIWKNMFKDQLSIRTVAAGTDPYNPSGWWKQGRQIRWVLAEYGAWLYYWWKRFTRS